MTEAYPLQWPQGLPRTAPHKREQSRFGVAGAKGMEALLREVRLMGGRNLVVSTNQELRLDGKPYARRRDPEDTGVAVYFDLDGRTSTFPCDQYEKLWENVRSICLTVECLRKIKRYGSRQMFDQAFNGFLALPAPGQTKHWAIVLGVERDATPDEIREAYKAKVRLHVGTDQMYEINAARDEALVS